VMRRGPWCLLLNRRKGQVADAPRMEIAILTIDDDD
jgi:hypothetical protein